MKNNASVDLYRSFIISDIDFKPFDPSKIWFQVKFTVTLNPYELVSINKAAERYPVCFDYITDCPPDSHVFLEELWSKIIEALVTIHNSKRISLIIKVKKYTEEMEDDYCEDFMYGLSKYIDFDWFLQVLKEKFSDEWEFLGVKDSLENTHDLIMAFPISMINLCEAASIVSTMMH